MKNTVIERIKTIIKVKKVSPRSFSESIKFNYSTLNNYLTGRRTTIDNTLIEKIISTYGDISAEWILTGNGSMFKDSEHTNISGIGDINGNISGNNTIVSGYGNSVGDSHNINLVLPKSGYQKIINSKGEETTIQLDDDNLNSVANLSNENKSLVDKIDLLTQMVSDLRERIKEKDEIIGMLRNQIDRT